MNKPVAWMFEKDGAYMCIKHDDKVNYDGGVPLYTHPVKEPMMVLDGNRVYPVVKELTDEEIEEVIRKHWNREYKNRSMFEFAKAILRKAQEK